MFPGNVVAAAKAAHHASIAVASIVGILSGKKKGKASTNIVDVVAAVFRLAPVQPVVLDAMKAEIAFAEWTRPGGAGGPGKASGGSGGAAHTAPPGSAASIGLTSDSNRAWATADPPLPAAAVLANEFGDDVTVAEWSADPRVVCLRLLLWELRLLTPWMEEAVPDPVLWWPSLRPASQSQAFEPVCDAHLLLLCESLKSRDFSCSEPARVFLSYPKDFRPVLNLAKELACVRPTCDCMMVAFVSVSVAVECEGCCCVKRLDSSYSRRRWSRSTIPANCFLTARATSRAGTAAAWRCG